MMLLSPCSSSFCREPRTFSPPAPNMIPRYPYSLVVERDEIIPSLVTRKGVWSTTHRFAFPSIEILREEDLPSVPALIVKPPLTRCDSNFPSCDRRPARVSLSKATSSAYPRLLTRILPNEKCSSSAEKAQSMTALNINGKSGSPCLTPLRVKIGPLLSPLYSITVLDRAYNNRMYTRNRSGHPRRRIGNSMVSWLTDSKALRTSWKANTRIEQPHHHSETPSYPCLDALLHFRAPGSNHIASTPVTSHCNALF